MDQIVWYYNGKEIDRTKLKRSHTGLVEKIAASAAPPEEAKSDDSETGDHSEGTFAEKLKMVLDGPERKPARFGELARKLKSLFARKAS